MDYCPSIAVIFGLNKFFYVVLVVINYYLAAVAVEFLALAYDAAVLL